MAKFSQIRKNKSVILSQYIIILIKNINHNGRSNKMSKESDLKKDVPAKEPQDSKRKRSFVQPKLTQQDSLVKSTLEASGEIVEVPVRGWLVLRYRNSSLNKLSQI